MYLRNFLKKLYKICYERLSLIFEKVTAGLTDSQSHDLKSPIASATLSQKLNLKI